MEGAWLCGWSGTALSRLLVRRFRDPKRRRRPQMRSASNGAGDEIRTRDSQHGKLVLYQLSYSRSRGCAS